MCICSVLYCTDAEVILESPVHPVMEGDPLTLRCSYRKTPANVEADIYKDGSPLQPTITGEVTIPEVTQSHEGRYRCRHSDRGESPESWVTVRTKGEQSRSSQVEMLQKFPFHFTFIGTPGGILCCFRYNVTSMVLICGSIWDE